MPFTDEQMKAIKYKNGNILVSAAAGAGKTAVLVERILRKITSEKEKTGIDEIVVVTFTKAAASEMKQRLEAALEKQIAVNPGNAYIIRQLALLDSAKICTIDKFCLGIVKNYYNSIGIDPSFRMADEGELSLIKSDVLTEIMESHFAQNDKDFIDFTDAYATGKNLDNISELILSLYNYSCSNPWPEKWLDLCAQFYDITDVGKYADSKLVKENEEFVKNSVRQCIESYEYLLEQCEGLEGVDKYRVFLENEKNMLKENGTCASLRNMEFARMPVVKNADESLKAEIKSIRTTVKDFIKSLGESFSVPHEEQLEQLMQAKPFVKTIVNLTKEFASEYAMCKKKKNIADFSDVEHYALDILVNNQNGKISYTPVADELSLMYKEIYIDEYQDSNYVQEQILNAVSKERFCMPDTFMVGDVKQSIYRFRMAKPELFMEKYEKYAEEGDYVKIELHKNFRSQKNVLDTVNDIFYKAMTKNAGGVDYNEKNALYAGRTDSDADINSCTVIDMADKESVKGLDSTMVYGAMAARTIKKMMKENQKLRYRDFAILLRSDKAKAPVYASVLSANGIDCVYEKTTGYFDSPEVMNVLDMLRVIDNPRQEIALAGVMRSYFAFFTSTEMAQIKGKTRKTQLYDCVLKKSLEESELGKKCKRLFEIIENYRKLSGIMPIHELLDKIIYDSGYIDYVSALPGAKQKKSNVEMLVVKAKEYTNTSYSGLFNFLRYIEKIRKFDVDFGESRIISENEDVVRIMSIHKSKGLEFPVVILGEAAKKYNLRDVTANILYDADTGISLRPIELNRRIRMDNTYRSMMAQKIENDSIGEELRILYVALTRAKEKLIIQTISDVEKSMPKWSIESGRKKLWNGYILGNKSYIDLIMPSMLDKSHICEREINMLNKEDIIPYMSEEKRPTETDIIERIKLSESEPKDVIYERIKNILEYSYDHKNTDGIKTKYSVSYLKAKAIDESDSLAVKMIEPERYKKIPCFVAEENKETGVNYGNAYHKIFELLEYENEDTREKLLEKMQSWIDNNKVSKDYVNRIDTAKILDFLNSPLGREMKEAKKSGLLFRERAFSMEIEASKIDASYPEDEKVLIQGVIDAFYFKHDKVFVVDYKTDRVDYKNGAQILKDKYETQLKLYCDALKQITGKDIGGCYIYSVCLGRSIELNKKD